jgi:hypothetical protein
MNELLTILSRFLGTPEKALGASLVLAIVTGVGWMIAHVISITSDRKRQQLAWRLEYTQKQLEELYGPLEFLLTEGKGTFEVLLSNLGQNYVFDVNGFISDDDLKTWMFWAEADLMLRNREIQKLLASKAHLIDGSKLPESFEIFLSHYSSWEIAHKRWKRQKVKSACQHKLAYRIRERREKYVRVFKEFACRTTW